MNDTTYDINKELLPLLYNSRLYDFSITLEVIEFRTESHKMVFRHFLCELQNYKPFYLADMYRLQFLYASFGEDKLVGKN